MDTRVAVVAAAIMLTLAGCGGGEPAPEPEGANTSTSKTAQEGEIGEDAAPQAAPGLDVPVKVGGVYTYPDGLEVRVGNWRIEPLEGSPAGWVDVTATNPTDNPITTTQAWVAVRAGDTGEELEGWAEGKSVDAVLQPGAEVTGTYPFDVDELPSHAIATVMWLEAEDPITRYNVAFALTEDAEGQEVAAGPSETMPAPSLDEDPEIEGKSLSYEMLQYSWSPQAEAQVCPEWEADPESVYSSMAGEYGTHTITEEDVAEFLEDKC